MIEEELAPRYATALGSCYQGDSLDVLRKLPSDSVSLVLTSPPFALRRRKAYGNVDASQYVEWFWPFAVEIHRVLDDGGSFVFDLGGAWNRGSGTRSLYQYELILRLSRIFHLAQEIYWYNPSKLPTPAEWVTIRRTRVKDAVNTLWWLSKTDSPRADNRRVLRPYSPSMRRLLRDGYQTAKRPRSTTSARTSAATTAAPSRRTCCKCPTHGPATSISAAAAPPACLSTPRGFPAPVPEFFINFLTEPGQLVLDPFAGSNMTGHVAERLERRWMSVEINCRLRGRLAPAL